MQPFHLSDGRVLEDLKQLRDALRVMPEEVYEHHVNDDRNDFANWVGDFFDQGLAMGLRHATTQREAYKAVAEFVKTGKFTYEMVIIGAGIAGIAAAIYASRDRKNFLIISKDFGGQINVSGEIENYPGFAHTDANEFSKNLKEQLEYNNIDILYEAVKGVRKVRNNHFTVTTENGKYDTKNVLVCSGARPRKLDVPGEEEFAQKGLSYCAICDGPLYKNKVVAVVGGGDAAMESALMLERIASKVYLLTINSELQGHQYLVDEVTSKENIEILYEASTQKIVGDKFVTGIEYKQDKKKRTLDVDGIFIDIGRIPNTDLVKQLVELDDHGHIVVDKYAQASVKGIYAAGDCTDIHEYQYVIAAGQAVTAFLKATMRRS